MDGLAEIWAGMSGLLEEAMEAISELAEHPESDTAAEALTELLTRLASIREAVAATVVRRPMVALWRAVASTVDSLQLAIDQYLAAFSAGSPSAARSSAADAQRAIDAAAASASDASRVIDRLGRYGDLTGSAAENFSSFALDVFEESGAPDIVGLDAMGAEIYRSITGHESCPTGFGAALFLTATYARSILDEHRYMACAQSVFESLQSSRASRGLAENADWWSSFRSATREMVDSAHELETVIQGASGSDRLEVRGMIRFAAQMIERIAPVFVSTVLVGAMRKDWRSLVRRDAGALVDLARQAGLQDLLVGFDRALRNADAHGSFEVEDHVISFSAVGREYDALTRDELADRVLACLESLLALHAGIASSLMADGVPIEKFEGALDDAWSPEEKMSAVLAMNGIFGVSIEISNETLEVRGRSNRLLRKPVTTAAHLHPHWPTDLQFVRVSIEDPEMVVQVEGPARLVREWNTADGLRKETAMIALLAEWRINGQRVANRPQIRRWTARRAEIARQGEGGEVGALIDLAVTLNDRKLERALKSLSQTGDWTSELVRWYGMNVTPIKTNPYDD